MRPSPAATSSAAQSWSPRPPTLWHEVLMSRSDTPLESGPGGYGYTVVGAASIIMVLIFAVQYSFGVFFKPVLTEFGWTRAMTAGAFSLVWISQGIVSIVMGDLNDRVGP